MSYQIFCLVTKLGTYLNRAPYVTPLVGLAPALLTNIRLGWKWLSVANVLTQHT